MYAKVFASMWDGTLGRNWEAWSVFVYLLANCDRHGIIDVMPESIADRSHIPLEAVERGLRALEQPDRRSRSATEGGRRIVPLDEHRDWGWRIVNFDHYRSLINEDDRRAKDAERKRTKRQIVAAQQASANVRLCPPMSAHAEADAEALEPNPSCPKKDSDDNLSIEEWFEKVFWKRYPKREAKAKAIKALKAAFKGVTGEKEDQLAEEILAGLERHKARWSEPQFIPLPASWINARRWEDELDPAS